MKAVAVLSCRRCGASNAEFDLQCLGCGEQLSQQPGSAEHPAARGPEAAGRLVGGYELLESLGRGGMGQVYRARQLRTGRVVALKTVTVAEAGLLEGLRREIRALSALRHPDIVRILEQGVQDGLPWYAMELVRGQTLRAWARQRAEVAETWPDAPAGEPWWTQSLGRGGERRAASGEQQREHQAGPAGMASGSQLAARGSQLVGALTLVRRLCVPLAYLHGEGLVHHDLKPENVLLRNFEFAVLNSELERHSAQRAEIQNSKLKIQNPVWPVLVDFGLSMAFSGMRGRELLEGLRFGAGTVAYMAPEQIRGEPLDARADLYSLGCVLYELVTGRRPFEGSSIAEVLEGHLNQAPRPPSELVSEVPKDLDELILRLLAKEPRQRFGHANDVAAALGELGAAGELAEGRDAAYKQAPKPRAYLYRSALAGREEPMRQLEAALSDLQEQGAGGLLLVGGESGVGKTRLLQELSRQAEKRGVRVLAGECVPGVAGSELRVARERQSDSSLPATRNPQLATCNSQLATGAESVRVARGRSRRSPLLAGASGALEALRKPLQAVADRCRERGPAETERLLGRRGKVLALYEPALAGLPGQEAYPDPAELPPAAARLRVYAYLAETLAAFGEGSAMVVLLDDLQWADELTLGFLEYWLRLQGLAPAPGDKRQARPVLLVGAYRSEEVDTGLAEAGAAHASPLRRLIDGAGIVSIELGRLEEAAVGSMVGDMLALRPAPGHFARHLARHSEGNPFFVAEYLRAAVDEGLLGRDGQGVWQVAEPAGARDDAPAGVGVEAAYEALPLPRSLRELVGRRLAGLAAPARKLMQAAAVLGREFEIDLLRAVGAQRDALWFDAISELLRRQVLEAPAPGTLRFVHDKLREVAYEHLRNDSRKKLHRAAAQAIAAAHAAASGQAGEPAAELGHHWEEAGQPDKASPCYLAAARRATVRYDHAEAERLYRAYLRLVEEPTAESVTARIDLGERVLQFCGRNEEAISGYRRALDEARLVGARQNEARALHAQGRVFRSTGRQEQARQLYEQALAIHREMGDRSSEGIVLGNLGNLDSDQGRREEARQLYEQALAIHREVGDRLNEGIWLGNLGVSEGMQGRQENARQLLEQALAVHREVGHRTAEGVVLANLGTMNMEQGRPEEARQLFEQAHAIYQDVGFRAGEGMVLGSLGILCMERGRPEEARQLYEQAYAIHREVGNRSAEGQTLHSLACLALLAMGDLTTATHWAEQGEEYLTAVGDKLSLGKLLCNRGHIELAGGRSGRGYLERAQALAEASGSGPESELGRNVSKLCRAVEAFDAGEQHRLFRGELLEDIPEGLRRWLRETGQLPEPPEPSIIG